MKNLLKIQYFDEPLLGPNIWIFTHIGLLEFDNKLLNFINWINKLLLNFFIITQIFDLFLPSKGRQDNARTDMNLLLTNLKFTCVGLVTAIKCDTFVMWKAKWKKIFDYIKEADIEERVHEDDYVKEIVNSYFKYSRVMIYACLTITGISSVCAVSPAPIFKYIFISEFRENVKNESIHFPYSASVWVPFNKDIPPGCWVLFTWHFITSFYIAVFMSTFDASMLVMMKFFQCKLKLLQYRCSLIYQFEEGSIANHEFRHRLKICHNQHNSYLK